MGDWPENEGRGIDHDPVSLIGEIGQIISHSPGPEHTLSQIARHIALRFGVDVCSIYLFDAARANLVLRATHGLNAEQLNRIALPAGEGLTGFVAAQNQPLLVVHPERDPRFKYFAGSGEERLKTYLGIPLRYHNQTLGVLVAQSEREDGIQSLHVPLFTAIASQISGIAAYSGLMNEALSAGFRPAASAATQAADVPGLLRGHPVSPGTAEAPARYHLNRIDFSAIHPEPAADTAAQIERLDRALELTRAQVRRAGETLRDGVQIEADLFEAYQMILADPSWRRRIVEGIGLNQCAEYALKQAVRETMQRLGRSPDPYLAGRVADIEDLGLRVLRNLLHPGEPEDGMLDRDIILLAEDLAPIDLIKLQGPHLKGVALCKGGKTSHTVLLAKTLGIPMVIGLNTLFDQVREGDRLILDGASGNLFCNPTAEVTAEYAQIRRSNEEGVQRMREYRLLEPRTLDGRLIQVGANIGLQADLVAALGAGADHIGLYRTEFPFLMRGRFLSEEEQVQVYQKIVEKAGGLAITIRTLDIGGDKFLPSLDQQRENNPYLGWRSIRMSLDMDVVLREQVRAILRVSALGPVRMLLPMISSVAQLRRVTEILAEEKEHLRRMNLPFDDRLPVGVLVEVPAAVSILPSLLRMAEFVNIGTNDLIQYTVAVDRNNPRVASLYNPLHPAVLASIRQIVQTTHACGRTVSVCGDAASEPKPALLMVGMGVDALSVPPGTIPTLKRLVRSLSYRAATQALQTAMRLDEEEAIDAFLDTCLPASVLS